MVEKYDLICSLGGNCAAAHNLQIRNLRKASYPFDWTYFNTDNAIDKLSEGFKNGFINYMRKENLEELPINPSHPDRIQLKDKYGEIVWANQFSYTNSFDKNYTLVKKTFDRRFKRLLDSTCSAKDILFLFSINNYIKPEKFLNLLKNLKEIYPDKNFQLRVLSFNCETDDIFENENIKIFYYKRNLHEYDFLKTSVEWSFLDNIKPMCKKRNKISFKLFGYKFKLEWNK